MAGELILHHYDFSNYSEKVRLGLGYKELAWHSVTIPAFAPKPSYEPLTGGYRRTPALQIGADVFCDTRLILEELEARHPEPPFYPDDGGRSRALGEALVHWAEKSLMRPIALYITGLHADRFSSAFHADRASLHGKSLPSVERVKASAAKYKAQVDAQLPVIEALLEDHDFVLGASPTIADFALYEAPWFLRTIGGDKAVPEFAKMSQWLQRVEAIGHGSSTDLDPGEALQSARNSEPEPVPVDARVEIAEQIAIGEEVIITPFDQNSPASGTLMSVTDSRMTIASHTAEAGTVHVHFPRLGYRLGRKR